MVEILRTLCSYRIELKLQPVELNFMKIKFWFLSTISALLLCTNSPLRVQANPEVFRDTVTQTLWWQLAVDNQLHLTQNHEYQGCIWGDSISSALGDSLGKQNFNFAIGGMSTVSLIEQLKVLKPNHFQCQKAVIAIGTNDAMYGISDAAFVENLKEVISFMRGMGTKEIILIPAFYSTVAASYDPNKAGTLTRVDEINALINQVAATENLVVESEGIQALFKDRALNEDLTIDGVHLNEKGLEIYKQVLLKILSTPATARTRHPLSINLHQ